MHAQPERHSGGILQTLANMPQQALWGNQTGNQCVCYAACLSAASANFLPECCHTEDFVAVDGCQQFQCPAFRFDSLVVAAKHLFTAHCSRVS
jgi:hypothetical protein